MKKHCLASLFLAILACHSFSQDLPLRYFDITAPKHKNHPLNYTKVPHSLYNRISLLDIRQDTGQIGLIAVGLLKKEARLKLRMPFEPQLQQLLDSLTDNTAAGGELLLQLRNFFFIEESGTRYCYLQAGLYAKKPEGYSRLSILDTALILTNTDVHDDLVITGSRVLTDFLSYGLTLQPKDEFYSLRDIVNYDSVEKSRIPVFSSSVLADGLYYDYYSFSNQIPDQQGDIETDRKGAIKRIEVPDSAGKKVRLKSKNLYALVYKGKPFIATEYGYYPLEKTNNALLFTGDVKVSASMGDKNSAQLAFGLLGRALASGGTQTTYDMVIDHVSGIFIHLRKIVKDPQQL